MKKIIELLKKIVEYLKEILGILKKKEDKGKDFSGGEKNIPAPEKEPEPTPLLKPIKHRRYISLYCITAISEGNFPIMDRYGKILARISDKSNKRLRMEGTGKLPDGRIVNYDGVVSGSVRYVVLDYRAPYGLGIYNEPLVPWKSVAHQLSQLKKYELFKRDIVIPALRGYKTPDGKTLDGIYTVHDTGGGLRKVKYNLDFFLDLSKS